jgi:hypothetical protein
MSGLMDQVIPLAEQGIRLSPRDPIIANFYRIGLVHLLNSHIGDAVFWLVKARSANPRLVGPHAMLASAYALKGETELAAAELAEARRVSCDDRYWSLAHLRAAGSPGSRSYWGVPKTCVFDATYFAGLRKAGMPEE